MRDRTEDVEHEFAGGRGSVEALLEADQIDAPGLEGVNGFEQLAQRQPQAVEPGDAQAIPGPGVVDELGQAGPTGDYDWNSSAAERTNVRPLNLYPAKLRA